MKMKTCENCVMKASLFDLDCHTMLMKEFNRGDFNPKEDHCSQWCRSYSESELNKKYEGKIKDEIYIYHFSLRDPLRISKSMISWFKNNTISYLLQTIAFIKTGGKIGSNFGKTTFSYNGKSISFMLFDIQDKTLLLPLYYLWNDNDEN